MAKQGLNEAVITRAIMDRYHARFVESLELDAAIAGGGPAGLVAGYVLAKSGLKTAIFERKLCPGGGIWGGGMGWNYIVVQQAGLEVLDEMGIGYEEYEPGYYTASAVEAGAALILAAQQAGAHLFNLISVEDVMVAEGRVSGVVVNSSAIEIAGLHVDPVSIAAKYVIEATGHALEVLNRVVEKCDLDLATPSGCIEGERSMNAELGEQAVPENTIEIAPGLIVAGMAANAAMGAHRMGPVFGGMLLSGKKAAQLVIDRLS